MIKYICALTAILLVMYSIVKIGNYLVHCFYFYDRQGTANHLVPETYFVWNRVFCRHCDMGPTKPSCDTIIYDCSTRRQPIRSVYVVTTTLKQFIRQTLHHLREPFVLVTGCADRGPLLCVGQRNLNKLLKHPNILHWYATNLDFDHPKATALPIGLDYHTFWNRRSPPVHPLAQEMGLHEIIRCMTPSSHRPSTAFVQFGKLKPKIRERLVRYYENRPGFVVVTKSLKRDEMWREYTKYFFIVSPRGLGIDCHRIWEALILGCAVIVEDLPLNRKLLAKLPALFVKDDEWELLDAGDLEQARQDMQAKWDTYEWQKLTSDYWCALISSHH